MADASGVDEPPSTAAAGRFTAGDDDALISEVAAANAHIMYGDIISPYYGLSAARFKIVAEPLP